MKTRENIQTLPLISAMDSPTTPRSRRSAARYPSHPFSTTTTAAASDDDDHLIEYDQHHHTLTPQSKTKSFISPSPLHLPPSPLRDLLLPSPSPLRKPRDENLDPTPRRKPRSSSRTTAAAAVSLMACAAASPRNARRARRRLEKEIAVAEPPPGIDDSVVERVTRKRKPSKPRGASKKKLSIGGSSVPSSSQLPRDQEITVAHGSVDGMWEIVEELIMWRNAAKSTLWFGLGSLFFLSSSFSGGYGFSVISAASHLGILVLALAFFYDSSPQRQQQLRWRRDFQLTEEDIVCAARVVLPAANAALAKTREIFCGEPSMTLKVAPILLFTAKYGHLITLWRLFATGFFLSFTAPKLYSSYSQQIHSRVETARNYVSGAWKSCRHKGFIAASMATMFWNLFSVKTCIVAAFISVVIFRYHHQKHIENEENHRYSVEEDMAEDKQQEMVAAE